jgi:hypothetical protein
MFDYSGAGIKRLTDRLERSASDRRPKKGIYYPYTVHRTYLCGHPDEYVQVDEVTGSTPCRIQHCIVPPIKQPYTGAERAYQQTLERCRNCAVALRSEKRRNGETRSQNTCEGTVQADGQWKKDGFLHVLRRHRFGNSSKYPVKWEDEGPENVVFSSMKDLHEEVQKERGRMPHAIVPYEDRMGNRDVDGPGKRRYIVAERVDPDLLPAPRAPNPLRKKQQQQATSEEVVSQGLWRSNTDRTTRVREVSDSTLEITRHSDPQHSHSSRYYGGIGSSQNYRRDEDGDKTPTQESMRSHNQSSQRDRGAGYGETEAFRRSDPQESVSHGYFDEARRAPPSSTTLLDEMQHPQRPRGSVRRSGGTKTSDITVPQQLDRGAPLRRHLSPAYSPPAPQNHQGMLRERVQRSSPLAPVDEIQRGSAGGAQHRGVYGTRLSGDNVPPGYGTAYSNPHGRVVNQSSSNRGSGEMRRGFSGYRANEKRSPRTSEEQSRRDVQVNEEALRLLEGGPPPRERPS